LKQLEDENRRLKHIVAEQTLDIQALKALALTAALLYASSASLKKGSPSQPSPLSARNRMYIR
jgi:hypothetical protein